MKPTDLPIASNPFPGILPIVPSNTVNFLKFLKGDGTWVEIEWPVIEHEELHTDNGDYDA